MKKVIDAEIHLSSEKNISAVPAKIIQIFNNDYHPDDRRTRVRRGTIDAVNQNAFAQL